MKRDTCSCGRPYNGIRATIIINRVLVELCGKCAIAEYEKRQAKEN